MCIPIINLKNQKKQLDSLLPVEMKRLHYFIVKRDFSVFEEIATFILSGFIQNLHDFTGVYLMSLIQVIRP